jgi:hypothetical protein
MVANIGVDIRFYNQRCYRRQRSNFLNKFNLIWVVQSARQK